MRKTCCAIAILVCALGCGGGGGGGSTASASGTARAEWPPIPSVEQIGETIGTVDGMPIGSKEFDTMAARSLGRDGTLDEATRTEIVDRLVDEKLLYLEALRRGIDKDPKIQRMMVNTLLKQEVYGQVRTSEITEEELLAYFEAHKDEFVVPEKVQIKRILIKPLEGESREAALARAETIREEAAAHPDDFKALAQRHSQGPYARRGGDVGFVTPEGKPGIDAAVVAKAFAMAEGVKVSEVFETDDGFNILYIPNRRARVERTFQQMRGSVLRKIKADKYKTLYDDYVGGLRARAAISLDRERIAAHEVLPAGVAGKVPGAADPVDALPGAEDEPPGHAPDVPDEDELEIERE